MDNWNEVIIFKLFAPRRIASVDKHCDFETYNSRGELSVKIVNFDVLVFKMFALCEVNLGVQLDAESDASLRLDRKQEIRKRKI